MKLNIEDILDEDDGKSEDQFEEEEKEEQTKVEINVPLPPNIQTSIREIKLDNHNMFDFISTQKVLMKPNELILALKRVTLRLKSEGI